MRLTRAEAFKMLEMEETDDEAEIKRCYRRLALKWHPDKNDDPVATERFQQVSAAYAKLTSPEGEDVDSLDDMDDDMFDGMFGSVFGADLFAFLFSDFMRASHGGRHHRRGRGSRRGGRGGGRGGGGRSGGGGGIDADFFPFPGVFVYDPYPDVTPLWQQGMPGSSSSSSSNRRYGGRADPDHSRRQQQQQQQPSSSSSKPQTTRRVPPMQLPRPKVAFSGTTASVLLQLGSVSHAHCGVGQQPWFQLDCMKELDCAEYVTVYSSEPTMEVNYSVLEPSTSYQLLARVGRATIGAGPQAAEWGAFSCPLSLTTPGCADRSCAAADSGSSHRQAPPASSGGQGDRKDSGSGGRAKAHSKRRGRR